MLSLFAILFVKLVIELLATVSREQSSASYFDAPLDPNSEQEWFSSALKSELQEHKGKLSSVSSTDTSYAVMLR